VIAVRTPCTTVVTGCHSYRWTRPRETRTPDVAQAQRAGGRRVAAHRQRREPPRAASGTSTSGVPRASATGVQPSQHHRHVVPWLSSQFREPDGAGRRGRVPIVGSLVPRRLTDAHNRSCGFPKRTRSAEELNLDRCSADTSYARALKGVQHRPLVGRDGPGSKPTWSPDAYEITLSATAVGNAADPPAITDHGYDHDKSRRLLCPEVSAAQRLRHSRPRPGRTG